ncbi:MAG: HU family DNA-binding protein [Prevotella sp.]|nr:HU family DNA-binding protein [Treponema sp.]MBO5608103.1 HU family DNA-binding protein [Treponema sp.]MBP3573393.1 HU family DNA-binding protein [Prevotella sp.]
MTQTRADMAAYIKEHKDCTLKDAEQSAFLAVEWLLNAVASGERVELRGFGTFRTVEVPERKSNLPDGGIIPANISVKFRPAEALKRLCGRKNR